MDLLIAVAGWIIVAVILWDALATVVIPKTVERRLCVSNLYGNLSWSFWHMMAKKLGDGRFRMAMLASFAPIYLLLLFVLWAAFLVIGFGMVHFGSHTLASPHGFIDDLYFSGVTFFTLGFGDMTSSHSTGKFLSVVEAGTGFMFLALIIGYIPVLYSQFSQREHQILLLDSKAGSDPSAGQLLRSYAQGGAMEDLITLLKDWEYWSARQLESFLSYPVLAYYRSQHDHQSWLCSLTAILDTCALIEVGFEGEHPWAQRLHFQAQTTFAMGRHLIVDLAYVLDTPPDLTAPGRLPESTMDEMRRMLNEAGIPLAKGCDAVFDKRRALYEPYCVSLAKDLLFTLPAWIPQPGDINNWEFSAWDKPKHF